MTQIVNIEKSLKEWANEMVAKYQWLTICYEYSINRRVILVNCVADIHASDYDEYCEKIMEFEDCMNAQYGMEAPLFTENGELFALTESATCIKCSVKRSPMFTFNLKNVESVVAIGIWFEQFVNPSRQSYYTDNIISDNGAYEYALAA